MSGLLAALWLLGLFAAAPALRTGARYELADRVRDTLILGIAIPFALGFVHAFYAPVCWCALLLCIVVAIVRRGLGAVTERAARLPIPCLLVGALAAVSWPALMRPLLDGDSLSYHLPNAATWVQAHSLWTTTTHYWWYPPGSELFASALYAVSGPFALPWCGLGALALLGLRIAAWAREAYHAAPLPADALAAAAVTAYPLAIQGGTLQNDVWLAAFFLESLWALRGGGARHQAARALAITILIKPQGWLLALIALVTQRARLRVWLAAAGVLALWLIRDAVLWSAAQLGPANTVYRNIVSSTILAHGASALEILVRVAFVASPFALIALIAALLGRLIAAREPPIGWAACASAVLFLLLPFGYATSVAQLATGASLRFAAPAVAAGSVILTRPIRAIGVAATALLLLSTLYGVWQVLAVFWNDGGTHVAVLVALLAVAVTALAHRQRRAWPSAVAFAAAVIVAAHLAGRHPLDYFSDALRVGSNEPGVYRWIAASRPAALGSWGVRLGVVNVLSPTTRTLDLPDAGACAAARRFKVLLVAVAQNDLTPNENAARLRDARRCGSTLYADATAVVAQP